MSRLALTENRACASYFKVFHSYPESRTEACKLSYCVKSLGGDLAEHLAPSESEICVCTAVCTSDTASELVELGKSHTIRILNDKRVAVRYIYTGFDKRCADKHIYLAFDKPSPYIEKLFLAHSSVCNSDICFGYHRMNICGAGIYAFNAVVDIVNLSVAAKLLIYRLRYNSSVVLDNVCGYRVTVAGRSFNDTHIPYSRHRHI